jgi:hypothetical protein
MAVTDMGTTVGYATSYGSAAGFGAAMQVKDGKPVIEGRGAVSALLTAGAAAASSASAMSSMAGPGGAWAGAAMGMLNTAIIGGLAAYDANKTIAALREVLKKIPGKGSVDMMDGYTMSELDVVRAAAEFCIEKQLTKRAAGAANAASVGQPAVAAYRAGRAVHKWVNGTKGVAREDVARQLMQIATSGRGQPAALAREVVQIVLAKNIESAMIDTLATAMKS